MTCTAEGDFESIDTETALCLYRIAQEALHNVVKHAGARQAEVRLFRTADSDELTIADDGRGFDVAETRRNGKGLGLVSINERVRLAGGRQRRDRVEQGHATACALPERAAKARCRHVLSRTTKLDREYRQRDLTEPHHPMSPRRHSVIVADDHAIVKEGLVSLLKEHDFDVVGAVGDGHALMDAARRLRPDVIVTDLSMPGLSGLDVLTRLKAEHIDSKVIVLTMHHDADLATAAMRAGAIGFLLKHSAGEELLTAIHQALEGRVYLTPALTKEVIERMAATAGSVRAAVDSATT